MKWKLFFENEITTKFNAKPERKWKSCHRHAQFQRLLFKTFTILLCVPVKPVHSVFRLTLNF